MDFHIEWFDRLASTNALMRERFCQGLDIQNGQIVAAHEQTAGRGRQDRKWLSANGQNLCFSLYIQTDAELVDVPSLTMATALAVDDLLRGIGILSAPKWPNDVLVDGRKICGILSERVTAPLNQGRRAACDTNGIAPFKQGRRAACDTKVTAAGPAAAGIIVGIGLNVNMSSEDAGAIDRPATSILIESGQAADISRILEALLQPLEFWIGEWEKGGFPNLREIWTKKAGPIGKPLTVHDGDVKKSGTLAGFGDHGELLLETKTGIETIWSGDVS